MKLYDGDTESFHAQVWGTEEYNSECVPVDSTINVPAEKTYRVYLQSHSFLVAIETDIRAILYLADKSHIF